MFTKLKKKVIDEGGSIPDGPLIDHRKSFAGSNSSISSTSSVRYVSDSVTPPLAKIHASSPTSKVPLKEMDSFDGVNSAGKKLEGKSTNHKLESKITELVAVIKEKNKNIELLEEKLQLHEEEYLRNMKLLEKEHASEKSVMTQGFTFALQKKEEEMILTVEELMKNKSDLEGKLSHVEEFRERMLRREEEHDELNGLATQEMSKLKHMFLNAQEELRETRGRLNATASDLEESRSNCAKLTDKLQTLATNTALLQSERDEFMAFKDSSETLSKQKKKLESRLAKIASDEEELRKEHSFLLDIHASLKTTSELEHQKLQNLLGEKDDRITLLREKVATLMQQVEHVTLSDDDQVSLLKSERRQLERKVEATRSEMIEVKSFWSNKVLLLEKQIENLNLKISDDAALHQKADDDARQLSDSLGRQVEQLEGQVQALQADNGDLERRLAHEKVQLKQELAEAHEEHRSKLRKLREQEQQLQHQIEDAERTSDENSSELRKKQAEADKKLKSLMQSEKVQSEKILRQQEELVRLKGADVENKRLIMENESVSSSLQELKSRCLKLEEKDKDLSAEVCRLQKTLNQLRLEKQSSNHERDELLVRNAELSQHCESLKQTAHVERTDHSEQLARKQAAIDGLQITHEEAKIEIAKLAKQIEEAEQYRLEKNRGEESIADLKGKMKMLEDELGDKSKVIKVQQHRMADLKKSLQRELRVQGSGADEVTESTANGHSRAISHSQPNLGGAATSKDVRTTQSAESTLMTAGDCNSQSSQSGSILEPVTMYNEINICYLRHVILKFLLSRENEAIHLIKAISTILQLSRDEENLIKETLQYKMSWFRVKPKIAPNKIIPPSF